MDVYKSIMNGLSEALEYEKGNLKDVKVNKVTISEIPHFSKDMIKNIRTGLNLTQKTFAGIMGVSPKTVEAWECGRNIPQGTAQRMLEILKKDSSVLTKCNIIIHEKSSANLKIKKRTYKKVSSFKRKANLISK